MYVTDTPQPKSFARTSSPQGDGSNCELETARFFAVCDASQSIIRRRRLRALSSKPCRLAVWGRRPLQLRRSRAVGGDARTGLRKPVRDRQFGAHKRYFSKIQVLVCLVNNLKIMADRLTVASTQPMHHHMSPNPDALEPNHNGAINSTGNYGHSRGTHVAASVQKTSQKVTSL